MILSLPSVDTSKLGDTPAAMAQSLGIPLQRLIAELRAGLQNNLTFNENMMASVVTLPLVNNTERQFERPKKFLPIGFLPIAAVDSSGNALEIESCKFNARPSNGSGWYGVTAGYALQHQGELLEMQRDTSITTLANGVVTVVPWESVKNSRGTGITHSAGTFTVAEAGVYLVTYNISVERAGGLTSVQVWVEYNAERFGNQNAFDPTGGGLNNMSWPLTLPAGATFKCYAHQTNAALANATIQGANVNRARVAIQRLYNNTVQSGAVTGILVGG